MLAAGAIMTGYLVTSAPGRPPAARPQGRHQPTARPSPTPRVVKVESAGVVDVGPVIDGDHWPRDADDHPLMLRPHGSGVAFLVIPASEVSAGPPEWTVNELADGESVFIDISTGNCLTAASVARLSLAPCDLSPSQRWRPVHQHAAAGQSVAGYASVSTGQCLTAGRLPSRKARVAPAVLTACGPARARHQEMAFWWGA